VSFSAFRQSSVHLWQPFVKQNTRLSIKLTEASHHFPGGFECGFDSRNSGFHFARHRV
jgi:hypothetical protein